MGIVLAAIMALVILAGGFVLGFGIACDYWCDHPARNSTRRKIGR